MNWSVCFNAISVADIIIYDDVTIPYLKHVYLTTFCEKCTYSKMVNKAGKPIFNVLFCKMADWWCFWVVEHSVLLGFVTCNFNDVSSLQLSKWQECNGSWPYSLEIHFIIVVSMLCPKGFVVYHNTSSLSVVCFQGCWEKRETKRVGFNMKTSFSVPMSKSGIHLQLQF